MEQHPMTQPPTELVGNDCERACKGPDREQCPAPLKGVRVPPSAEGMFTTLEDLTIVRTRTSSCRRLSLTWYPSALAFLPKSLHSRVSDDRIFKAVLFNFWLTADHVPRLFHKLGYLFYRQGDSIFSPSGMMHPLKVTLTVPGS